MFGDSFAFCQERCGRRVPKSEARCWRCRDPVAAASAARSVFSCRDQLYTWLLCSRKLLGGRHAFLSSSDLGRLMSSFLSCDLVESCCPVHRWRPSGKWRMVMSGWDGFAYGLAVDLSALPRCPEFDENRASSPIHLEGGLRFSWTLLRKPCVQQAIGYFIPPDAHLFRTAIGELKGTMHVFQYPDGGTSNLWISVVECGTVDPNEIIGGGSRYILFPLFDETRDGLERQFQRPSVVRVLGWGFAGAKGCPRESQEKVLSRDDNTPVALKTDVLARDGAVDASAEFWKAALRRRREEVGFRASLEAMRSAADETTRSFAS